jgi:hypothetical protein
MALILADRVRETSTSTGTTAITLSGAYTGFQTFSATVGNSNTTYYTIANVVTGEWEVGIGTYTTSGNTLSRDTVLASSNSGSLVNFTSGSKDVFVTQPAERALYLNGSAITAKSATFTANGVVYASSTSALTTGSALTFDGSSLSVGVATPQGRVHSQIATPSTLALSTPIYYGGDGSKQFQLLQTGATYNSFGAGGNELWYYTASYAALTFGSDGNIPIKWVSNGSEQMRLTSTGLGIGTSSPAYKLDVATPSSGVGVRFGYLGGTVNPRLQISTTESTGVVLIQSTSSTAQDKLVFGTAGATNSMTLDSAGNLGLGVTPSAWSNYGPAFQIQYGGIKASNFSTTNNQITLLNNAYEKQDTTYAYLLATNKASAYKQIEGAHQWLTAGTSGGVGTAVSFTQAMTLDASGRLGIGQTSPTEMLTVQGTVTTYGDSRFNASLFDTTSATTGTGSGIAFSGWTNGVTVGATFAQIKGIKENSTAGNTAGAFVISTLPNGGAPTERARIDSSGNLGLGVTPSASWNGTYYKAFQIGNNGAALSSRTTSLTSSSVASLTTNAYATYSAGVVWNYLTTNPAAEYRIEDNVHKWFNAPSGTLNTAITFTQAMTLDASGNLGIGTSSPAYKLDVAGTINSSTSSATGYNLVFRTSGITTGRAQTVLTNTSGDLYTGIEGSTAGATLTGSAAYSAFVGTFTSNPFYLVSGGQIRTTLDTSGNLGLGVTPSASNLPTIESQYGLFVGQGQTNIVANGYYSSGYLYKTTAAASRYQQITGAHYWYNAPSGTAGTAITFTQAMTLDASGNLGVGTTSPAFRLDVTDNSAGQQGRFNSSSSNGTSIALTNTATNGRSYRIGTNFVSGNGEFSIYDSTAGAERLRIDSAGNLGLGVTPSGWNTSLKAIQISGVGGTYSSGNGEIGVTQNAYYSTVNAWIYGSTAAASAYQLVGGVHKWLNAASGTAGTAVSFTQAMTLDASGNWMLKTTSKYSSAIATISGGQNGVNQSLALVQTDNTAFHDKIQFVNTGGVVGSISTTGSVTSYNVTSDYRLKDIAGPVTNSGEFIDKLNPVQGSWKADGSRFIGFLAHELQEASETVVGTGVKDGEQMQSIDYSNAELIANMAAELKSLRKRLADAGIA